MLDEKTLESLIEILKQVGFPVFVACWFMFRTDKRLDRIIDLLDRLPRRKED